MRPAYGDSLIGSFEQFDTTGVLSGPAGANVTWDFSNVVLNSSGNIIHHYFDPASTPEIVMFPKSNLADLTPNGVYTYLNYSADSTIFMGDFHDSVSYHYAWDPLVQNNCPLNFGNTFTDKFARFNFGQCPYHHSYTNRTASYDAYGTLLLPHSSVSVARIKIIDHTLDSAFCIGPAIISIVIDTFYTWYDISTDQPVFSMHTFFDSTNSYMNRFVEHDAYTHLPAVVKVDGINEVAEQNSVILYPNPSNGRIEIKAQRSNVRYAEIYDMFGKNIFQSAFNSSQPVINIASQPDGVYFLKMRMDNGYSSQKIIIQK